ncbi:MAG TPA: hypothetical protein VJC21_05355 [Candidatus Nanoarchaeia archaeon]|nr:hypothetical protein [Candidatus Nanoarchaeia archaeon]
MMRSFFKFSFVGAGQLLPFIIALRAQRVFTNVMALSMDGEKRGWFLKVGGGGILVGIEEYYRLLENAGYKQD